MTQQTSTASDGGAQNTAHNAEKHPPDDPRRMGCSSLQIPTQISVLPRTQQLRASMGQSTQNLCKLPCETTMLRSRPTRSLGHVGRANPIRTRFRAFNTLSAHEHRTHSSTPRTPQPAHDSPTSPPTHEPALHQKRCTQRPSKTHRRRDHHTSIQHTTHTRYLPMEPPP